jgi:hypothetical protein
MGVIKLRTSHLDLDVPVSVHPAPDVLNFAFLLVRYGVVCYHYLPSSIHVDVIVTRFVNRYQVLLVPVVMVSIYVVKMYFFFADECKSTGDALTVSLFDSFRGVSVIELAIAFAPIGYRGLSSIGTKNRVKDFE